MLYWMRGSAASGVLSLNAGDTTLFGLFDALDEIAISSWL